MHAVIFLAGLSKEEKEDVYKQREEGNFELY